MRVTTWTEWIDHHIPLYDSQRHRERFREDLPQSVLIVNILDRAVRHVPGEMWETWDDLNHRLQKFEYRCVPMFLERDTRQEWYWAFWSPQEALAVVLKL